MSTQTVRPIRPTGVKVVAVLLFVGGAVSLLLAILGFIGAAVVDSGPVSSTTITSGTAIAIGIVYGIVGLLEILFAFGILRGNRAVRMIVTILEVLSVILGIVALITSQSWGGIFDIILAAAIAILLWTGATKDYFAK